MMPRRGVSIGLLAGLGLSTVLAGPGIAAPVSTTLRIDELGFDGTLRIRLFHDPGFFHVPGSAGRLFLVAADSASGKHAFFIPTDLAFEVGSLQVYPVEFEQASDLFGQALGGRLRPGETQLGFIMVPAAVSLGEYLPGTPDSVVVRYANHRAALAPADSVEAASWRRAVPPEMLSVGLTAWWEWLSAIGDAPSMSEGDRRFLAERVFPAQGHLLDQEGLSAEGLRNAILRVGERRLLETRTIQRVAPVYPAAARQVGLGGLVLALCYVTPEGTVGDAQLLASNTVHLLNLAALSAALEWRFSVTRDAAGVPQDGWRMIPFQFRLAGSEVSAAAPDSGGARGTYVPPRVVKAVDPEYPFDAKRRKVKGTVVYRVVIDETGRMVEASLEAGLDPLVDQASLAAIERTRFLPATRDGRPVRGELRIPFTFDPGR